MRSWAMGRLPRLWLSMPLGLVCCGFGSASAQQGISPYYAAPGNYGTSYGTAGYGAIRTYSNFPSPGYGRGIRPYAVAQNQWGSGIWNQGDRMPTYGQVQQPASAYQTWAVPNQSGQASSQPLPPIGAYAPTIGPGYSYRRPSAY